MKIRTFITQNKDYKIEFIKKENYLSFSSSKFIYVINFMNIYNTIIKSIILNDIEILILLDNLYAFIDMGKDLYIYLESKEYFCSFYVIKLGISEEIYDNIKYCKDIFILYNYYNKTFIPILQFEISDNIVEFMQIIYDMYFEDNDNDIEYLNPSYLL